LNRKTVRNHLKNMGDALLLPPSRKGFPAAMLKFGLVGCGRIAKRHSDLLGRRQIFGAELGAVCDVEAERARRVGEQFGVPYFTSIKDMMPNVRAASASSSACRTSPVSRT
jgi:predicted dinucleotide-utilizing enzyme